jgi:hypothetical protein
LLTVIAVLASTETAIAAPRQPHESSGRARAIVELFVAGSDRRFGSLLSAVDSPAFAGFDLRWERLEHFTSSMLFNAGTLEARVHCFVDLSRRTSARLYCSDRAAEHFVLESVPSGGPEAEKDTATLSRTIGLALDALLEDGPSSTLTREQAEAMLAARPPDAPEPPEPEDSVPAAPQPAATETPEPFPLRPGAFYRVAAHSAHVPVTHGPGLEIALVDFGSRRRGTFLLSAAYELPASYSDRGFDLALSSLALRAGAESSGALGAGGTGGSYLGGRLTGGIDITRLAPRENGKPASYEPHPGTRTESFVISAAIFWSLRLAPERSLFVNLSADIDPFAVHYDVASDHVETVIERFRVRPGMTVGMRLW